MSVSQAPERFVFQSGELSLVCHRWGPPGGAPVIFLHGFLDQGRAFTWVAEVLAPEFTVYAPDHRGHGLSGHIGAGGHYHFPDYIQDLDALYAHLGIASAIVIGHSMGASMAVYLAGSFPERVDRAVLLEGLGPPGIDVARSPRALRQWVDATRRIAAKAPNTSPDRAHLGERLRRMSPRTSEMHLEALIDQAAEKLADGRYRFRFDPRHRAPSPVAFDAARFEAFLRAMSCPTLVVWGAKSPFKTPEITARAAYLSDVEQAEIAGVGHNLHHEDPAATAAVVKRFIGGAGAER